MRSTIEVDQVKPLADRVLVRLMDKSMLSKLDFSVVRLGYDPSDDWELAQVEAVGPGDLEEELSVGDRILVRAGLGGKAGADVSKSFGERKESLVIVTAEEVVCVVTDEED